MMKYIYKILETYVRKLLSELNEGRQIGQGF